MAPTTTDGGVAGVRRALALLATATLVLAGCAAAPKQEKATPTQVTPNSLVAVTGPAPVGRFYVKAGARDLDSDLYEVTFSPPDFRRLTTDSRVTTVGGCASTIVVAAAQRDVGYADRLQEFRDGKLVPLDALGLEAGSDPHVSDDCRILYIRLAKAEPALVNEVKLWDPVKRTATAVIAGETIFGASWGPAGEIVVLKRETNGPRLLILRKNGAQAEIDPQTPDVGNVQWGKSGWLAMDIAQPHQPPTGTLFLNPATGARSVLDGWLPLTWSPDGQQLLVSDSRQGTTLAVVELPDLSRTRAVGVSTVGTVWDAVWLPQS
jgi:hypothetical protein